ncbi:MAG: type II toxin-antitoxin system HicB family antitoxin [Candidatus Bipolaricaulota bacterium]
MSQYLVVIEKADGNYSAYAPDLPGCVATGKTLTNVKERMREAIAMHIRGLQEDGLPVPVASSSSEYVTIGV